MSAILMKCLEETGRDLLRETGGERRRRQRTDTETHPTCCLTLLTRPHHNKVCPAPAIAEPTIQLILKYIGHVAPPLFLPCPSVCYACRWTRLLLCFVVQVAVACYVESLTCLPLFNATCCSVWIEARFVSVSATLSTVLWISMVERNIRIHAGPLNLVLEVNVTR